MKESNGKRRPKVLISQASESEAQGLESLSTTDAWVREGPVPNEADVDDFGRSLPYGDRRYDTSKVTGRRKKRCGARLPKRRCICKDCGTKELHMQPDKRVCKLCGQPFARIEERYCQKWAMNGADRCKKHGALVPRGENHPAYVNGQYSKYKEALPKRLGEVFDALSKNANLLAQYDEIVLLDVRLSDLAAQLEGGNTPEAWNDLSDLVSSLEAAIRDGDADSIVSSIGEMKEIIKSASGRSGEIWAEIRRTVESKRKVIETERKTLEGENAYVRPDEVIFLATQISKLVREYIHDPKDQTEFSVRLEALISSRQVTDDTRRQVIEVTPS